jgi:hypothetical protein
VCAGRVWCVCVWRGVVIGGGLKWGWAGGNGGGREGVVHSMYEPFSYILCPQFQ